MKPSRPFRQRRLNDHMGGVKYKISNLGAGDILRSLNLEQDKWQWEASFERGFVSGGKLYYLLNGRPQIVARLALDKDGVGKLSSDDNATVFPSTAALDSFKQILNAAESDASRRARG